jgi:hypothetical protein
MSLTSRRRPVNNAHGRFQFTVLSGSSMQHGCLRNETMAPHLVSHGLVWVRL